MKKIALFPGSFDPFTKGHEDIVLRGISLFDEIIIAIGINAQKKRYFSSKFMIESISETFKDYPQIKVIEYQELTAHFAKKQGANYILRGVRNTIDFEYENTIAQANKHIFGELETVFLITSPQLAYISSTIVRDLHRYGEDVSKLIPYPLEK